MKIIHYEAGQKLYGGAYQVVGLIERLQAGAQHILFCPRGSEVATAVGDFAATVEVPIASDLDPRPFFALRRLLRRERPDLLHIHSRRGADLWGPLAARAAGVPFLVSRRVDNLEPGWLLRTKYRGYRRAIGISQRICGALCEMGLDPERVVLVRSGVDVERYKPRLKTGKVHAGLKIPDGALLVGMVAQFIPRKGHADLVAAARAVLAERPHTVFVLFGKGALRDSIQARVAQEGLASSFRFAGFRDDLPRILPELDLLVHPAHREGLGVAILQASASGLPVVATRAGGIVEIVVHGETGLLVPPANPPALARALVRLLKDPVLRQSMGGAGRDFIVRECSLEATAAGNGTAYLEILRELRGG